MMPAIDKGLANSRIGLVLVTPAFLAKLGKEKRVRESAFSPTCGQLVGRLLD
jgi:hypothetical protein